MLIEIAGIAKSINSVYSAPFEIFTLAGLLYRAINVAATPPVRLAERRLARDRRPAR